MKQAEAFAALFIVELQHMAGGGLEHTSRRLGFGPFRWDVAGLLPEHACPDGRMDVSFFKLYPDLSIHFGNHEKALIGQSSEREARQRPGADLRGQHGWHSHPQTPALVG